MKNRKFNQNYVGFVIIGILILLTLFSRDWNKSVSDFMKYVLIIFVIIFVGRIFYLDRCRSKK